MANQEPDENMYGRSGKYVGDSFVGRNAHFSPEVGGKRIIGGPRNH